MWDVGIPTDTDFLNPKILFFTLLFQKACYLLFYMKKQQKEKEKEREKSSTCWFTLQTPAIARAGPGQLHAVSHMDGRD